ncbi:MAG: TonB family protein [Muribaculaceae bacterium]|nr:TonB family protein [Muribaculaceae bacterium]
MKRDRLISAVIAVAIHLLLLIVLTTTYLRWPPADPDDSRVPVDSTEILLVNEYINLGDMLRETAPSDAPRADAPDGESLQDGNDLTNTGEAGVTPPVVASQQESPMKVNKKEKPEKTGPTKEELAERERIRREQETRDKISRQMTFSGTGKGDGVSGKGEGENVSGAPKGEQGHDLAGRTILHWGKNSSRKSGVIRVSVTVNPEGKVIKADYAGGEGAAAGDNAMRSRTIKATYETRFSPLQDSDRNQTGTITWRFK